MLTIGEFSRVCLVTKKTLRHYDEIGLLRPEYIAENGYRYYKVEQLDDMMLIAKLKAYGFSLPEIAAFLSCRDMDALHEKLLEKREQMQTHIDQTRHILEQLDMDVEKLKRSEDIMEHNFVVKTLEREPERIYGIRKHINVAEFQELFAALFQSIAQKQLQPAGPPLAFYHDEEFDQENADIEVAISVGKDVEGSRMMPGGLHCYVTVTGPYSAALYTPAYTTLFKWIEENGYHITGAPFDRYVRGGGECPPEENITEIFVPISK